MTIQTQGDFSKPDFDKDSIPVAPMEQEFSKDATYPPGKGSTPDPDFVDDVHAHIKPAEGEPPEGTPPTPGAGEPDDAPPSEPSPEQPPEQTPPPPSGP